jgi:hypothetical protein
MRGAAICRDRDSLQKPFSICFRRIEARRARFPPAMDVIGFYGLITSGQTTNVRLSTSSK